MDIYEVMFEIKVKDEGFRRQTMIAPEDVLILHFLQLAKQIRDDPRPIQIRMIRQEIIWDQFEQKQNVLNNEIVLSNNAWTASNKE